MTRPCSVFIDDTLVTLLAGSLGVENRIEERSTAAFTIIDLDANQSYQRGQVVEIYEESDVFPYTFPIILVDDSQLVFAGFIEIPEAIRDGDGLLHTIECKDNHYLVDKRLVVKSYTDKTLAYIVNDILTAYLVDEGISAGIIQTGPIIKEAIFNYVRASECFDALKELSGFIWQINADKTLDFLSRETNSAPWSLSSTQIVNNSAHLSKGNPAYRNRQYVRGGIGITSQQTENFTGDAIIKAFTVGYPIAKVPTVTKDSISQTVGIKGLDSGKDCYWNKGDATITFDTAPGNGLAIQIIYYGLYPVMARFEYSAAISERQSIEGGTGIVEDMAHEAQLESAIGAWESAWSKLKIYCQNAERFSFQTRISGLKAGQLLPVTYSPFGFSSHEMLIESMEIAEEDSTHLIYSVAAITGPVLGSWSKFFSNILTRQDKSIRIGDSFLLVLLQVEEILALTEVTSIYEDEFAVSGNVNRWLNSAPINAGSIDNVQHERLEMTEVGSESHHVKNNYLWDHADTKWDMFSYG